MAHRPEDHFTSTPEAAAAYEGWRSGWADADDDDRPTAAELAEDYPSRATPTVVRDRERFTYLSGILDPRPGDRTTVNGQPFTYQP
jgi:hypothetical protein